MATQRFVGLSKHQIVPRLLNTIGESPALRNMKKPVEDDDPPLSDSDSDNGGLPTRGDIRPSQFAKRSSPSPDSPDLHDTLGVRKATITTSRPKRTAASAQRTITTREPSSSPKATSRQSKRTKTGSNSRSPSAKKAKKDSGAEEELGRHFERDIFAQPQNRGIVVKRKYGASKTFGPKMFGSGKVREITPPTKFRPPPKDSTPETSPDKPRKFRMPSSPSKSDAKPSPARKFKAVPTLDKSSPAASPRRTKRLKMPKEESRITEESQPPAFKMPDDSFLDSFTGGEPADLDFTLSPAADGPPARRSTSPLTDLETLIPTAVCPLCNKEVDADLLTAFKSKHPRMTVSQMQKFCHQHKKRSAHKAWLDRGYPDIKWSRLDARIAERYDFLRGILEDDAPSHFGDLFRDRVRAGSSRTLLQSDANLTPGYYGIRGLRAMSENLIGEFSGVLRRRALQDRLVAARGHTAYLQAVLVPELAVRLIMEDMDVGAEEARGILKESCWVGELLNDEIADVVLDEDHDEGMDNRGER